MDVLDYNEQVIQYITLPNILLNTVLQVHASTDEQQPEDEEASTEKEKAPENEKENEDEDEENDEDDEKDGIIGENVTCDAEAELPTEHVPDMLQRISQRTRAFVGDWSGLPVGYGFKW